MMFQKKVEITVTDNGFVLEWSDDTKDDHYRIQSWPHDSKKTRGVEIYSDKKKLLKRLTDFL